MKIQNFWMGCLVVFVSLGAGSSSAFSQGPKNIPLPAPFEALEFIDFHQAMLDRLTEISQEKAHARTFFVRAAAAIQEHGYQFLLFEKNPSAFPQWLQEQIRSENPRQPALTITSHHQVVISIHQVVLSAQEADISPEEMLNRLLVNELVHIIFNDVSNVSEEDRIPGLLDLARTRNPRHPLSLQFIHQVIQQILSQIVEDVFFGFIECDDPEVPGFLTASDLKSGSEYYDRYYVRLRTFFIRHTFVWFFGIGFTETEINSIVKNPRHAQTILQMFNVAWPLSGQMEDKLLEYLNLFGLLRETRPIPLSLDCLQR